MPSGRDVNTARRRGGTTKKNAFCSFCRKSYRDVGPWSKDRATFTSAASASSCASRSSTRNARRRGTSKQLFTQDSHAARNRRRSSTSTSSARKHAKKVLAVAVHSHYKRLMLRPRTARTSRSTSRTSC